MQWGLRGRRVCDRGRADASPRGPSQEVSSVLALVLLQALVGAANLGLGLFAAHPVGALDALAGLEVLVDLEEVLDFQAVELRHVVDLGTPGGALVRGGNAQDLVIAALLVAHAEHAERAAADHAAGEGGLLEEHQGVQRVAVLAQGVVDETVVIGVTSGREEHAIQADATRHMVDLVLVSVPLGDLDGHVKFHGRAFRFSPETRGSSWLCRRMDG